MNIDQDMFNVYSEELARIINSLIENPNDQEIDWVRSLWDGESW